MHYTPNSDRHLQQGHGLPGCRTPPACFSSPENSGLCSSGLFRPSLSSKTKVLAICKVSLQFLEWPLGGSLVPLHPGLLPRRFPPTHALSAAAWFLWPSSPRAQWRKPDRNQAPCASSPDQVLPALLPSAVHTARDPAACLLNPSKGKLLPSPEPGAWLRLPGARLYRPSWGQTSGWTQ